MSKNNNSKHQTNLSTYSIIQSALLFAQYGLGYMLPWYVRWFPTITLIVGFILIFMFGILLAILGVEE